MGKRKTSTRGSCGAGRFVGASALALAVAIAGYSVREKGKESPPVSYSSRAAAVLTEDHLDLARSFPETRQTFLNALRAEMEFELPYCSGIVYDPDTRRLNGHAKMLGTKYNYPVKPIDDYLRIAAVPGESIRIAGKEKEVPIYVAKTFFTLHSERGFAIQTIADAKNIMQHEGQHVRDDCEGLEVGGRKLTADDLKSVETEFGNMLSESRAFYRQIEDIRGGRRISKVVLENVSRGAANYMGRLVSYRTSANPLMVQIAKQEANRWVGVKISLEGNDVTASFEGLGE